MSFNMATFCGLRLSNPFCTSLFTIMSNIKRGKYYIGRQLRFRIENSISSDFVLYYPSLWVVAVFPANACWLYVSKFFAWMKREMGRVICRFRGLLLVGILLSRRGEERSVIFCKCDGARRKLCFDSIPVVEKCPIKAPF